MAISDTIHPDNKPLFLKIKETIEDQIVNDQLREGDQVPSTTQLSHFYRINHITVLKGMNMLVESGLIFKKRGVGMFVAEGAKTKLLQARKRAFADHYVRPMLREADNLGLTTDELLTIITEYKERNHES